MTKTFRDLNVDPRLCDALERDGITHPFAIQELTLPLGLQGHDLIGQARTGTGKTLAFGLPLLQRIDPSQPKTQALVVVPTRELCVQVADDLSIGAALGLTSISVYGGVSYDEQIDALTSGVHVVVGTPGRLLDHLGRGNLDLSGVTQLVLDEADEMLDMGFLPDVERLIEACTGQDRHTMLFSATMPTAIVKLARRYLDHPTFIRADTEAHETAPTVTQHFLQVHRMDKPRVLARILQSPDRGGAYVFVRTKHMADRLVTELEDLKVPAIAIHGDLRQQTRERNLDRFRQGKATVLVATEVAARGLDVTGVSHVINYDCPDDEKMYLHRIGRTARAGEAGVAVTFAEFNEVDRLNVIRKAVGAADRPVEQVFSTSERLAELFELPDERPWDHLSRPSDQRARTGRSDGRPKSDRRSEGAGADHDARRRDRGTRDDQRRDTRGRQRDRGTRDDQSGRNQRDHGARDDQSGRDQRDHGGRGGQNGRDQRGSTDTAGERTGAAADAQPRVRTRVRARSGQAAGSSQAVSEPRSDTPGRSRSRARSADTSGTGDGARTSRDTRRDTAGAADTDEPRRERRRGTRDGEDASGTQRSGRAGGRQEPAAKRSGRDGSRSGRRRRSGAQEADSRSAARADEAPTKLERRGAGARGDGQPQLARRVKVEHLP